jgi:hypothetical protein
LPVRWIGVLLAVAAIRFLFQALFVPSFEGPDELYHLSRITAFADASFVVAFQGTATDGRIIAAVQQRPCGESLHRHFGCRLFGREEAMFNLLRPLRPAAAAPAVQNPENNQPPLFYALVGAALRLAAPILGDRGRWPEVRLLISRLIAALSVLAGLWILIRLLLPGGERLAAAGLLAWMLMPGASEALARCSNDAAVFLWSAGAVAAVYRRAPAVAIGILAAAGPLIKLTAFPIVAFVMAALWTSGRRRVAALSAMASLVVFPVQLLRGWNWGGTYELNREAASFHESAAHLLIGLGRSAYTFFKTAFWLGNWSFFKPPLALLTAFWLVLLLWVVSTRYRPGAPLRPAHLAAAAGCTLGALAFFVSHRRFWGDWGGVGGWYLWSWVPWLAMAIRDLFSFRRRRGPVLLGVTAGLAVSATIVYLQCCLQAYGGRP